MPAGPLELWGELLDETELSLQAKAVVRARVIICAAGLRRRVTRLHWLYRLGRGTVTVGALLLPALTGLDSHRAAPETTFWLVWVLGLLTGLSNGFLSLFGVDRKYFLLKEQLVRLEAEAWFFLSLSGKYRAGSSHQEQLQTFMEKCEAILDKAARVQDVSHGGASGAALPLASEPGPPSERVEGRGRAVRARAGGTLEDGTDEVLPPS